MKKIISLFLATFMILCFSACSDQSAMQKATGASAEQSNAIVATMESVGVDYETIVATEYDEEDEMTSLLARNFVAYDVTDRDGNSYRMSISSEDYSVITIVNSDGEFLYGSFNDLVNNLTIN